MTDRPPEDKPLWLRLCRWLWGKRGLLWGTIILGTLICVVGTWLFTPWGTDYTHLPIGWAIQNYLLFLFAGGCLLVLTAFLWAIVSIDEYLSRPALMLESTEQSRAALVHRLHQEYTKQLAHALQGIAMIALGLHERTDVTRSPTKIIFQRTETNEEIALPSGTSIVEAYDDAGQGLLILGEPGAGKTTLLLELANELLRRAENNEDPAHRVPVILNLSSWALKKQPLEDWIIDQLQLAYSVPTHLSRGWLDRDQWLVLLDGFDEVEVSVRSACAEAINTYRGNHFTPVVVCSRSSEYLAQEVRLALPCAVVVQPLQEQQVTTYLKQLGKPLAAVRATLQTNAVLRQLITSPLMLGIVILTYRGKTVKDLPKLGSAEKQQEQIFERYIQRMVERRTVHAYYTPQQTLHWLTWLAQQLKQRNITDFYLEQLQPTWLSTDRLRGSYRVLVMVVTWLGAWLIFGLLFGLSGGPSVGLPYGLLLGWAFGLGSVLWANRPVGIQPAEVLRWSWKDFSRILQGKYRFIVLLLALSGGLCAGLIGSLAFGLMNGLAFGLIFGAFMELILGLSLGLSGLQITERLRIKPNQGVHRSGWNALRILCIGLLVDGLITILLFWLITSEPTRINLSIGILSLALSVELALGLLKGGIAYLAHYILRYLLWRDHVMPWRYVRFLDEASERALLQRMGGGYRFIHPLFLDYFASHGTPVSPPESVPQQP